MQATCSSLDTSHLLRDILQTKDSYQAQIIDNNNSSSTSIKDMYTAGCHSDMISPLLHSKSSDMAFNIRDTETDFDNEIENDGDIDVATETNSCVNGGDQSDDLDERSLDTSGHEDNLKNVDHESFLLDSKEAKRAHVENILSSMRQSPHQDTMESSTGALTGDFKRQKRKQPQPQQHECSTLHSEELALQRQILQLQEQMIAVKRKREEDLSVNDVSDDIIDDDITDGETSKPNSPLTGAPKRERVEHILGNVRPSPRLDNGLEFNNRVSPSSENGKKQKRKQTQPQQHDNSRSGHRDGISNVQYDDNNHGFVAKKDEDTTINEDCVSNLNNLSRLYETNTLFRNNLYHNMGDKELISPVHNGFDPHLYRDNFFRHNNFLSIRPDFDTLASFKNVSKTSHARGESGRLREDQSKLPSEDLSKIAVALKAELSHAVSKAIDNAVSKVFSEKQPGVHNIQHSMRADCNSPQQQRDRHQQPDHQHHHQQKHQHPANLFPHFLHQHQQLQQQHRLHHHHQQQQQHQPSSQVSEREALKETVNNSQGKKKPELVVPFSDHLHFLERYGNRFHQEKMSAFDPLNKPQSDLITPHTGPAMSFHPHFPYYLPTQVIPPMFPGEPEQTEALSLIVNTPKKKRTKVTDTRLSSPRGKPSVLQDNTPSSSMDLTEAQRHMAVAFPHFLPPVLPTSVAITNPSLSHSDFLALRLREAAFEDSRIPSPHDHSRDSPRSLNDSPQFMSKMEMYERGSMSLVGDLMDGSSSSSGLLTSTLTPMHLRKAKLMFFFTRYPSSSILKMYFPDVMFNKNNTAQLVKWFSNFREFFYIQMEKYARQALAEGCKHVDDLAVTADSELFRHLNLHYNRNNQLEVPHNFLAAVQAALKEFFKAVQSNKDSEPSWKKAIYKIIARMDETLPDFFKSANWMEQLGDQ